MRRDCLSLKGHLINEVGLELGCYYAGDYANYISYVIVTVE